MIFLPFLHTLSFIVYLYLAGLVFYKSPKSPLNLTCSAVLMCFGIWSFGMPFIHNPNTPIDTVKLFQNIDSVGWINFGSFSLWFSLVLSEKKRILKSKFFYLILFIPPLLLSYRQWTVGILGDYVKQPYGWSYTYQESIWVYFYYLYYTSFMVLGLYSVFSFSKKTDNLTKKKQCQVIFYTILTALIIGSLNNVVLTELNIHSIPQLANAITLIWAFGVVYVIVKYRFLTITPATAADNIISTMADCLFLLDQGGKIVTLNNATLDLLEYKEKQLQGKSVKALFVFEEDWKEPLLDRIIRGEEVRNRDYTLKTKSGKNIPVILSSSTLRDEAGDIAGIVCIARDITERKQLEERLAYMATHDPLTDLPNRTLFNDRLTLEMAHAQRNQQKLAVMLLDLDHFKEVNDELGHDVGDMLVQAIADRLKNLLRKSDTVARMGGDEFMLIFPGITREEHVATIALKILKAIRKPFVLDGHKLHITTSIGIAIYPDDGEYGDTLMRNADTAMYSAKIQGRNNYKRYTPSMEDEALE